MRFKKVSVIVIAFSLIGFSLCSAEHPHPEAPAALSWLPHGYGQTMHVVNTVWSWQKGLHGYRSSPEHIGSWSHPLWGWDVNGYYQGPQVPDPDPGQFQLPIGLVYPDNAERLGLNAKGRKPQAQLPIKK